MRSPNSLGRLWSITTYISKNVGAAQSCLFSLFGLWFVGLSRIDPTNDSWLLPTPNRLDHAVAQLNWEFYRSAPVVQWSPVLIPDLGVGWGTVYVPFSSGSLFGLIFKWFDFILPDTFQFLGLWLLFSFTMLGYWSVRLVRVVADKPSIVWLGSTLLALSPTIFYRIGVLGHFELSAHWLLFAAIWNYFSSDFRGRRWALICVVTLVVNVYLFAMVFAVFLASFVKHLATGLKRRTATLKGVVVVWLTSISFAVFGFLEYRENARGLGFFRSNALSFLYPNFALGGTVSGSFSRLLDWSGIFLNRPFIAFEREGFNYLGTGVVLGIVLAVVLSVLNFRHISWSKVRGLLPLLIVSVAFYLNSLSNQIALGRREIFQLPIPSTFLDARQIFRTAERFVWLLAYVLVLFVIASVVHWIRNFRVVALILGFLLLVQILDSSAGIFQSRQTLHSQTSIPTLNERTWDKAIQGRTKIALVPTFDFISDSDSPAVDAWLENTRFFPLLKLAADENLSTNFSVTGRPVTSLVSEENRRLEQVFLSGNLDKSSIYVFATRESWDGMRVRLGSKASFEVLDGYFVMYSKP